MKDAVYGRMKAGKCIDNDRELGCQADVLDVLDNLCSGRDTCNIQIGSNDIGSKSSCWKDLSQYLDASYICRKGQYFILKYGICYFFCKYLFN